MSDAHDPGRRAFVLGATAALSMPGARGATAEQSPLARLSAVEAVARMTSGELAVESYAAAMLERCRGARALNAFITLEPERVLEEARACDRRRLAGGAAGPLFGLPIPIKDSVNTRDYPTTAGTPALRDFRPAADAPIVAALRAAGAIVLGKTNLHELSYGWSSDNLAFGAVHNPYDPTRIPGGSSGGTAAAIAARLAPLGVAEDTEGSIRVPAALCGIQGFRPTTGRYPTDGCVPITALFDQVGPQARCVADLQLFDAVAAAGSRAADGEDRGAGGDLPMQSLRGVRLGVPRAFACSDLDPEVARVTGAALARLERAGASLIDTDLPELAPLISLTTDQIQSHDVLPALTAYLRRYGAGVDVDTLLARASPDIRAVFARDVLPGGANVVSAAVYRAAVEQHLPRLRRLLHKCFQRSGVAALVFPATLVPAPRIGATDTVRAGGRLLPFDVAVARNIAPGSTAGLPGLVLPAGLTADGLPVALEFDGPAHGDRALLRLGLHLEAALGPLPPPGGAGVAAGKT